MRYKIKRYRLMTRRLLRNLEHKYKNHRYAFPLLVGLTFAFVGLILATTLRGGNIIAQDQFDDSNIVLLHVDNQTKTLPTREKTVKALLDNAGVKINSGDVVEPALDTKIDSDDFRVNVYRAAPVVIHDSDKRIVTTSAAQTSRSIADQAGIEVYPEDEITTVPSNDFMRDGIGSKVVINRSTPATLNIYGTSLPVRTHAKTVGELLSEKNVILADGDQVTPSKDTTLQEGVQVFVTRYGVQVVTAEESIAMPVETVEDASLSFGTSAIRQVGAEGKKSVTYEIQTENGVEVGRKLIQEVVVQEPIKQIVARGKAFNIATDKASVMRASGIAESDFPYVDYIVSKESHWGVTARNSSSGAYGLCQAMPGSKMASVAGDWESNPVTQLKWCSGYANDRYGSWQGAYNAWVSKGWW